MSSSYADGMEMVQISIERSTVGTTSCESGDYHEDAKDTAEFRAIASNATMHAISTGHTVNTHASRSTSIRRAW